MAADKNITIEFKAKGDKDLIDAFKQLATAQAKYNNVSKGTTAQSTRLNSATTSLIAKLTAQGKSFKDLGLSTKVLSQAYQGNKVAIEKMRIAMKKLNVEQGKTRKGARLLDNTFATLRSQMLLFQFAMGTLGVRALIRFTAEAAKVESMSRAFNTLSGGATSGTVAIEKLRSATNNTMSEFDLFQQANNAMVLGITKNSDEMAEMFDIAQRLGRALGVDTARSVESLITGIGRQSRLMLDNIGIIVKSDEAYEKYAQKLGTTADKLSDADKKTAFLQATMESARAKVATLGSETLSSQDSFDAFSATVSDLSVALGEKLKGAFSGAMDAFVNFVDLNRDGNAEIALNTMTLDSISTHLMRYRAELKRLENSFSGRGAMSPEMYSEISEKMDIASHNIENLETHLFEMMRQLMVTPSTPPIFDVFKDFEGVFNATTAIEVMENFNQKAETLLNDFYTKRHEAGLEFGALEESRLITAAQNTIDDEIALQQTILDIQNHFSNERAKIADKEKERMDEQIQAQKQAFMSQQPILDIELDNDMSRADRKKAIMEDIAEMQRRGFIKNKDMAEEFDKRVKIMDAQQLQSKLRSTSGITNALSDINVKMAGSAKASARLAQIGATIDALAGANVAFRQGGILGFVQSAIILAQGFANVRQIEANIRKFETGGLVGGRRHSQGGTLIEAEQGEFVMSRNAVQAVGIEAMNRINQGGGAGSVNISFSGNVMSQDFIEGEAIPMIKEAIRRGADIGVS